MKKFNGIVNGITYDNKKDYHEAVSKAVEAGEVNAHSEYVEVDEPKEPEKLYQLTKEDMDENMAIPDGYEIQLRPRSGLAIKEGIALINCVGTIDAGTIFKYL